MKKVGEQIVGSNCVAQLKTIEIECTPKERKELKHALAVIAKLEKVLEIDREAGDWTTIHSYCFDNKNVTVRVDQGACG